MIISTHNLVCYRSFNEFQLIFCRNVMIYFDRELQNQVFHAFDQSLMASGFLALGTRETLRFSAISEKYEPLDKGEKIWKKIR